MFSLLARCHGECALQKNTLVPATAEAYASPAVSFPLHAEWARPRVDGASVACQDAAVWLWFSTDAVCC